MCVLWFRWVCWAFIYLVLLHNIFTFNTSPRTSIANMFGNFLHEVDKKTKSHICIGICVSVWTIWIGRLIFLTRLKLILMLEAGRWSPFQIKKTARSNPDLIYMLLIFMYFIPRQNLCTNVLIKELEFWVLQHRPSSQKKRRDTNLPTTKSSKWVGPADLRCH